MLLLAISFETAQQLYYISHFNLNGSEVVTYFDLFKNQTVRWVVWAIMSCPLILLLQQKSKQENFELKDSYSIILLIIVLVATDILIISFLQNIISGQAIVFADFVGEYVPFFAFQKAPLYTLGYICMAVILYFYTINRQLQDDILQLGELKRINANLYQQLSHLHEDKSTVLKIKIGNKQKLVPADEISWIEADDYCAKVHTIDGEAYSMRISLKALEKKLGSDFLRVHRGAIVNMRRVSEFRLKKRKRSLILLSGAVVSVSKSKRNDVKDFLAAI